MTDSKIRLKHRPVGLHSPGGAPSRPPAGSLASRILVVCVLLLVIPLFLQSLFLYRQEYKDQLNDVTENLVVLAKERANLIEEMIKMDWKLLELAPNVKPQYNARVHPAGEAKTEAIFGGPETNVKPLYMEKIPLPQGVTGNFAILNSRKDTILVGKQEAHAAFVIPIPTSQITHDIPIPIPVSINLITKPRPALSDTLQVIEPIQQTELFLQLTVKKSLIHGIQLKTYYFRFATLLFFVGVIGGGAVYLFTRRISRPLKSLCRTMERVSEGAAHARYTSDKWGFEINQLGLQFNETLDGLLRHAQEAERERITREKLAEELKIGHEIQASLVPSHVPGLAGLDIATGYLAAKEVNGDFYDLFRLENGKLLVVICDAAGKGISGCLYSLGLRSMIRSLATSFLEVAEVVRRANDLFWLDAHESAMFSTLWLGLYDPTTKQMIYCSQGHPPALLRRGGELQELWTGGIALGAQKVDVILTKEVVLQKGDLLVLYTDGIIEAHDIDDQLFGKKRLEEFLLRKKKESATQIADQLIEEVHLFSQGAPQHDDMTLIIMHISH